MRFPLSLAALLMAGAAQTAIAQQPPTVEGRVNKLEREMRAVQRKVFPDGSQQFVEPEIRPAPAPVEPAGVPASGALIDLTSRVDSLERQVQQITNQAEQNQFRLRQLEERVNAMAQAQAAAAAPVLDAAPLPAPAATPAPTPRATAPAPVGSPPRAGMPAGSPFATRPTPAPAAPAPATEDATAPASTGDPAEDAYLAGYRLWEQKRYPEAQAALKAAATKYPKHRRYSYAQNLLGRAYLDEGKPALAAEALYANYRTMPRGERAPDSLYYLGQSLVKLKKNAEACRVYDELNDVYGPTLGAALKARVAAGRTEAKCGA